MAWVARTPVVRPSDRNDIAAAFDSGRGRYVVFGGLLRGSLSDSDETWELDGLTWIPRSPAVRPAARIQSAMAYDSNAGRCLLFGGVPWNQGQTGPLFGDTWQWDGNDWVDLQPTNSPPARTEHCLAYDSGRDVFVLFGGGFNGGPQNDTWEFVNGDWVQRQPSNSPPPRCCAALVYDPNRQRTVMYGGYSSTQPLGDTWEWNGTDWTPVTTANAPPPRGEHAIAFDPQRNQVVVYGGFLGPNLFADDTWTYDGNDWTRLAIPGVGRRWGPDMDYDPGRGRIVLVGGQGLNSVGIFGPLVRSTVQSSGVGCPGASGSPWIRCEEPWIGNPATTASLLFGGAGLPAVFGFSVTTGQTTFGPCTLYLAGPPILVGAATSLFGTAQVDFELPYDPSLRGQQLFLQGFVLDPGAAIGIAATPLATLTLGD